ncbi:MAG: enoyl-CoA hydratase/isomerase family protein [Anaerolineae bacterium]|nr:enoyl-CoA hydratase/isomerase family protein [Anaerolineae bacterium]
MSEKIHMEADDDGVVVLTFNRPEAHNALNLEMMQQFAEAIQQLRLNPDVRVLVLTGAGSLAFCAGGDLEELSRYPAAEEGARVSRLMGDALLALEHLPFPVIAAVNGYALGGGSEIALACDMRIVDANVRMGLVHIRLGLIPGWGAGQRLLRLVGYARAMEILLRGRPMQAQELQEQGLVNQVVEAGAALPHALEFARSITAQSPAVVSAIKQLLLAGINHPYEEALQAERELFPELWAAPPHLDAVAEFLRSRKG